MLQSTSTIDEIVAQINVISYESVDELAVDTLTRLVDLYMTWWTRLKLLAPKVPQTIPFTYKHVMEAGAIAEHLLDILEEDPTTPVSRLRQPKILLATIMPSCRLYGSSSGQFGCLSDLVEARTMCESILEHDMQDIQTLHTMAMIYVECGQTSRARPIFEHIMQRDNVPGLMRLDTASMLADVCVTLNDLPAAMALRQCLHDAILRVYGEASVELAETRVKLALLYLLLGDEPAARRLQCQAEPVVRQLSAGDERRLPMLELQLHLGDQRCAVYKQYVQCATNVLGQTHGHSVMHHVMTVMHNVTITPSTVRPLPIIVDNLHHYHQLEHDYDRLTLAIQESWCPALTGVTWRVDRQMIILLWDSSLDPTKSQARQIYSMISCRHHVQVFEWSLVMSDAFKSEDTIDTLCTNHHHEYVWVKCTPSTTPPKPKYSLDLLCNHVATMHNQPVQSSNQAVAAVGYVSNDRIGITDGTLSRVTTDGKLYNCWNAMSIANERGRLDPELTSDILTGFREYPTSSSSDYIECDIRQNNVYAITMMACGHCFFKCPSLTADPPPFGWLGSFATVFPARLPHPPTDMLISGHIQLLTNQFKPVIQSDRHVIFTPDIGIGPGLRGLALVCRSEARRIYVYGFFERWMATATTRCLVFVNANVVKPDIMQRGHVPVPYCLEHISYISQWDFAPSQPVDTVSTGLHRYHGILSHKYLCDKLETLSGKTNNFIGIS